MDRYEQLKAAYMPEWNRLQKQEHEAELNHLARQFANTVCPLTGNYDKEALEKYIALRDKKENR